MQQCLLSSLILDLEQKYYFISSSHPTAIALIRLKPLKLRLKGGKPAVNALNRQLLDTVVKLCSKFLNNEETQEWISRSELNLVGIMN